MVCDGRFIELSIYRIAMASQTVCRCKFEFEFRKDLGACGPRLISNGPESMAASGQR